MIDAFLDQVCGRVRAREAHARIREELAAHAEALRDDFLQQGLAPDDALRAAVARLGSPDDLGRALDAVHRPRLDWVLAGACAALVALGVGALDSARQAAWAGLGIALGAALAFIDYRRLRRAARWLHPLTCAALLALHLSPLRDAGKPFLPVGPLAINLVDLSPLLFAVALAALFADAERVSLPLRLAALVAPLAIYPTVGGLTSSVLFSVTFLAIAGSAGVAARQLAAFAVVAAGLGGWAALATPIAPAGASDAAPATDFIANAIAVRLGWPAVVALPALAGVLVARLAHVGARAREPFGALLAHALASLLAVKFIWNLATAAQLLPAPESGLGLPLVSHEGSLLVVTLALVGLVLSVERRRSIHAAGA